MVTQIAEKQNQYGAAFRAVQQQTNGAESGWLRRLRESAFDRFEQVGFPAPDLEEWKYTNVSQLAKSEFTPALAGEEGAHTLDAGQLAPFTYKETRASRLVFVNGIYNAHLSSLAGLPAGVVALDLAAASVDERYHDVVREQLGQGADYQENGFTALNTALWTSGAFILIPRNVRVETPLHLLFLTAPGAGVATVSFPRVLVVAEAESEATIIESYAGLGDEKSLTNSVVEVVLEEGARLEHYKVQRENANSSHIAAMKARLGRNSKFETVAITLGAQLSRQDIIVALDAEGAECRVDGLYIVSAGQHMDTHSLIEHREPNCTSRQLYKGILDGKSRAVFNGKVFVHPGAQQTDAQQTNRNLLLSKEARVDTKPQLEIFADDVKCAHGATVGQLEEEELFYLISRGLHRELAQNLLTYGFAEEVIANIKIESIKEQLDAAVLNRLHARLEV